MKDIVFENVSKTYGKTEVVKNLNFRVREGERLILLGPSGCGKSTTLRMIAGLEEITAGNLYMNGRRVNDVPSGERNVAMVFQNYALYPHMTVRENITYGLKVQKVPQDEIEKRLDHVLEMLQLIGCENRLPKDLSGGQRQRVALARALVKRSNYFLLDEPLSNLDAQLRISARKELKKIHDLYKQTIVYVTHDQIEAMTLGDRIALMYDGKLQMLDTPENVYNRPANVFTARFIGSPPTNILKINYFNGKVHIGSQSFTLSDMWVKHIGRKGTKNLLLGIRPEHIEISAQPLENSLRGKVKYVENQGNEYCVYTNLEGQEAAVISGHNHWRPDELVYLHLSGHRIHFFNAETEKSIGYPEALLDKQSPSHENIGQRMSV